MLRKILIEREIPFLKGYKLVGHISDTSIGDRNHYILIVNLINLHEKGRNKIKLIFQYDPGKNGTYWHSQKETIGFSEAERLCFEVVPHGYKSIDHQNSILKNPFWQEFLNDIRDIFSTLELINS